MSDLQINFNDVWAAYAALGWSIARSGAMRYIIDNQGKKVVVATSHDDRMKKFLSFVR